MKALLIGAPIAVFVIVMAFAFLPGFDYDISVLDNNPGGDAIVLGGWLHVVKYDADGNIVSEERVHNRFVDTGEEFVLDQVFQDATTTADNGQIAAICIGDQGTVTVAETETAADFDGDNGITENNCKEDTAVTTSGGQGVIGPLTFTCGGTNCADGDTVTGIAICQPATADNNDFNDCATNGIMFSVIDITDVTLNAGETVDIDYTFDITSPSN